MTSLAPFFNEKFKGEQFQFNCFVFCRLPIVCTYEDLITLYHCNTKSSKRFTFNNNKVLSFYYN